MMADPDTLRQNDEKTREEIDKEMKAYLNPHDRFAQRMKASLPSKTKDENEEDMVGDNDGQI